MKLWKKILIGISTLILLCIGGLFLLIQSLPDMCGNQVLAEYPSPNNKLKAVTFERDCGATTGFSTQVSILSSASVLENEGGNIFVADTNHGAAPAGQGGGPEVQVNWLSETRLQIQHHKLVRIHRAETKSERVQVEYVTF
ncbi:MAG TPA: hypothetical protein VIE91_04685 [Methylophilaceae bacterium]|jgi:hypothetical protein